MLLNLLLTGVFAYLVVGAILGTIYGTMMPSDKYLKDAIEDSQKHLLKKTGRLFSRSKIEAPVRFGIAMNITVKWLPRLLIKRKIKPEI